MLGTTRQPSSARPRVIAPYDPLPWQVAPWRDRSRVVLLTGSAGGGKSRVAGEKLHAYCQRYPGAFALVVRKTRVSMTKGVVLFLKRTVIGDDPRVEHLKTEDMFYYRNGSILAYLGLEDEAQRERLKSIGPAGGVDIVWGEEATELEEADHNALLGRLRGTAAPWRQILYTCNPDGPLHWIKRRLIDQGEARVYYSQAADNPHNPADYLATLGSLTGIDAARLGRGEWSAAEGQVYDTWSDGPADGNVTEAAEYVPGADVYWFVDDGYSAGSAKATRGIDPHTAMYVADSHPRVFLLAQLRADGRLCVFAEDYACLTLSDRHIARVQELGPAGSDEPYPEPERVIYGPGAAEIRGRLVDAELSPRQSGPSVAESIKELRRAFAPDANGWRRVLVHPRCAHLRRELASYQYEPGSEKPLKQFDHGPDALRVGFWALRREL